MKNFATCTPREFLAQTVRIKRLVKDWLDSTKILDIRNNIPKFKEETTAEEKKKITFDFIKKNMNDMFDSIFEKNADKTLELLALINFIEPEDIDNYEMGDLFEAVNAILSDERVLSFFISLVQLDQRMS